MEKLTCKTMVSIPDADCYESMSGLPNYKIAVVRPDGEEITFEHLQQIAEEQHVDVSEIKVLSPQEFDNFVRSQNFRPRDAPSLDEFRIRDHIEVPQLLAPSDRDDDRPWYNHFDGRRKRRR